MAVPVVSDWPAHSPCSQIPPDLTANTGGDVYIKNIGPVTLGSSSAGSTNTFSLIEDIGTSGGITLSGPVTAGTAGQSGTIVLSAALTGGIVDSGFTLTAANVSLNSNTNFSIGFGTGDIGGSGNAAILTNTANLAANTSGNVFIQNTGNVALGASKAGATNTFSLVEDTSTDGGIILTAPIMVGTSAQSGSIVLRASGAGGIDNTAGVSLTAGTNTLSSDSASTTVGGTGNKGTGVGPLPVLTNTSNLTANTGGDVFVQNSGNVSLGASHAGATNTFSLIEDPSVAGSITLAGSVGAGSAAQTGTIVLTSSQVGAIAGSGFVLTAGTVTLSVNISGTTGGGSGDISSGAGNMPILTDTANLSANTSGNVFIKNTGDVNLGASSAGANQTFSLVEDTGTNGGITLQFAIGAGSASQIRTIVLRTSRHWRPSTIQRLSLSPPALLHCLPTRQLRPAAVQEISDPALGLYQCSPIRPIFRLTPAVTSLCKT